MLTQGNRFYNPYAIARVARHGTKYTRQKRSSPTQRLLFGKILKSWDKNNVDLAMSSQKNQELERQIEASRTVRRKKVQLDPNELFADIEDIRRTQIEAGVVLGDSDASEESDTPSEARSTIVVAASSVTGQRGRG